MIKQIYNGKIHTPSGWVNGGSIVFENGKILEVKNDRVLMSPRAALRLTVTVVAAATLWNVRKMRSAQLPRLTLSMALPPYSPLSALRRNR